MFATLMKSTALVLVGLVAGSGLIAPILALAASSVGIDNEGQGAVIDSRYSSTLTVSGRGFQAIRGGHGGIYVWFGTVKKGWQPSQGGRSGIDYHYVPDSESKNNSGFQRYVAFPGSDTASAAAGTMSQTGAWSVNLVVPGPKFQAVGRNGTVETVDCTKVTCGVITVGAHGVRNANNETFTAVSVRDLTGESAAPQSSAPSKGGLAEQSTDANSAPGATGSRAEGGASANKSGTGRKARPNLEVDRSSAVAGRALSFVASGLRAGEQFSVVLDDGLVASGPHVAGRHGRAVGVLALPADLSAGTHELRTFGAGRSASVKFGVVDSPTSAASATNLEPGTGSGGTAWWQHEVAAVSFAVLAALAFMVALLVALGRRIGGRRAQS